MPRPNPRIIAFMGFSSLILVASAAALASGWPATLAAARAQSAKLVGEAPTKNLAEAAVDYQLATWLNPSNQAAHLGIARTQIAAGHADTALTALEQAGEGSDAGELRIRTLIELGRTSEAANRAATLTAPGRSEADVTLAAFAYALAGRTPDIAPLNALVSSPEAVQRLARIAVGEVPLAGELYAASLPESARALLLKLPTSFERNLLLAHIYYDQHSASDLSTAREYLSTALTLNPASIEARKLLAAVYTDLNQPAEASNQTILVQKLEAGKP